MGRLVPRALGFLGALACLVATAARADLPDTIDRIKPGIVVVGTFLASEAPNFRGQGTGFVVGDGRTVATNAHVVILPKQRPEQPLPTLRIQARLPGGQVALRAARLRAVDEDHDLALLDIDGEPLPALTLASPEDRVREGQAMAFTGFPIGTILGFSPATHRASVSAITPIVLPKTAASQLNALSIRRIREGSFDILQLDGTAYPGNSGSPLYDANTGVVHGVINMVFVKGSKESAITAPSGIAYAIPTRYLSELLARRAP